MPGGFGPAMHGEVFWRGHGLQVVGVAPLQSDDKGDTHACGQVRIFTVRFLTPPPARISENVDVRRPYGEPTVPVRRSIRMHGLGKLRSKLRANDIANLAHQWFVERCGHPDRLRKYGCFTRARNTVQPLVPPVVFRNSQSRDSISGVPQLSNFLLQSHLRDKIVDTLLDWQLW